MGMNNAEQKAWEEYNKICDEWEIVGTLVRRFDKHREDIEFSMPSLQIWRNSLENEYRTLSRKHNELERELTKINEEIESLR